MILKFKEKPVANSLSIFMYYKRQTGRPLEKDIKNLQKIQETEDLEIGDIGPGEILTNIYYAMRCAGESKTLNFDQVISEIDMEDIVGDEFNNVLNQLFDLKKK